MISFLGPEIFKFSYYANLVTNDITSCACTVVRDKIKNISTNNEAMVLKFGRDVAPYKNILMLLWQHARFQSLTLQNQILPFTTQQGKIPGLF